MESVVQQREMYRKLVEVRENNKLVCHGMLFITVVTGGRDQFQLITLQSWLSSVAIRAGGCAQSRSGKKNKRTAISSGTKPTAMPVDI